MSREDIVAIASRLFAVFIVVFELRLAGQLADLLSVNTFAPGGLIIVLAVLLGMLTIASFLWFFPLTVARKLLPVMREPRSEVSINTSTAFSLALTVMGIWFLANSLIDIAYWLVLLAHIRSSDMQGFELTPSQEGNMAATSIKLTLSLWLILGSTGVKRVITRWRYGETSSDAL